MRRSEWVIAVYFTYVTVLCWFLPVRASLAALVSVLNLTILAGLALLIYADSLRRREFLSIVRDWYPTPLVLMAYREMGWFAQPHRDFRLEQIWVEWDRVLLRDWGVHAALEALGSVVPSLLEIAYTLVYTLGPLALAMLYVYRRRERVDRFLLVYLVGTLLCYAQFPFWPSEPPRTVFPGKDFPSFDTVFRQFNWWMLGGYGIHTSVFPSAHVASAFAAAFGMKRVLPEHAWVSRFLQVMAVLIATATVYGRYHYAADAVAGLAMSLMALGLTGWLEQAANGSARPSRLPRPSV
jgi:membrane-associated phospholipid phosphatase